MLKMIATCGFLFLPIGGLLAIAHATPAKEIIASCRATAKAQGLKGAELKTSVDDCVAAQDPKAGARLDCHQLGKKQGLADQALKDFVKTCVEKPKQ